MKKILRMLAMATALCASAGVHAQFINHRKGIEERISEFEQRKEKAMKPTASKRIAKATAQLPQLMEQKAPIHRALQTRAEEGKDIVLLDSVISNTHCAYYEYNEQGWLVSEKHYMYNDTGDGNGSLMFDTEDSYFLEYDLDAQGRCTRYAQFLYNADETKGQETERVVITWFGDKERTEQYFALPNDEKWDKLEPTAELSYDKYGNYCLLKFYDWDPEKKTMIIEEHWEMKFTGNVMEYYYDEEGNYEGMDFGDDFDLHCYYYVDYYLNGYDESIYYVIDGFKIDKATDGLTTTKTRYKIELDESEGDVIDLAKVDTYWEFTEEEVITLTPSRNRYASVYYYEVERDEDTPVIDQPTTRAAGDKVLDASYVFEWDEHERLVKLISTDEEGNVETYTCSYVNEDCNTITLKEFENALFIHRESDWEEEICVMEGFFYGRVYKQHIDTHYGYADIVCQEYDTNGNLLYLTFTSVLYSEMEIGEDLNGDGTISEERSVFHGAQWNTYDTNGNLSSYIDYNDNSKANYAYTKYEFINRKEGELYISGLSEYVSDSKDGPWILSYEDIQIFETDPSEDPNANTIGGWYRSYNLENKTWSGYKWEIKGWGYVEYPIDPETGEFIMSDNAQTTHSGELQPGYHDIHFEEDGWEYRGYEYIDFVWDETQETEVLKVVEGWMEIRRRTNGGYHADNPADNYEFPVGIYFMGIEKEDIAVINEEMICIEWDRETDEWRVVHGKDAVPVTTYYTNEKGQIVNETKSYVFDSESERMVALSDVSHTIYSFDAQNRLSTIEYPTYTVHYTYLNDEYNYLLESHSIDKESGAKYDVCKYYYSNGKYIPPYTDIEEVEVANTWVINGTSVMADGEITLYNMNGQFVARGNGTAIAPQSGLYIVEVGGARTKILIK